MEIPDPLELRVFQVILDLRDYREIPDLRDTKVILDLKEIPAFREFLEEIVCITPSALSTQQLLIPVTLPLATQLLQTGLLD
jgi:hypothetical protein